MLVKIFCHAEGIKLCLSFTDLHTSPDILLVILSQLRRIVKGQALKVSIWFDYTVPQVIALDDLLNELFNRQ